MDAATLYIIMTVASGNKRTMTEKFPTIVMCEQAAQKLRKKTSMKETIYYCVKRKPDASEKAAVARATAAAAAAKRRQMQSGAKQQQSQGAGPIGMPRDFYSGTTAPQQ